MNTIANDHITRRLNRKIGDIVSMRVVLLASLWHNEQFIRSELGRPYSNALLAMAEIADVLLDFSPQEPYFTQT